MSLLELPKRWGVLERFKEEVIFQMRLKGKKVFKVEKDVNGIPGMAGAQTTKSTWLVGRAARGCTV